MSGATLLARWQRSRALPPAACRKAMNLFGDSDDQWAIPSDVETQGAD
jgi:hypothetical protein